MVAICIPEGVLSLQVQVGKDRAHFLKAGSGPALVMLHGGASDSRDWIPVMDILKASFTIYAPDILGFGRTERSEEGYYLRDFVDFTAAFLYEVGVRSCVMMGHSFGGRISLEMAVHHPEKVTKLALVDPAGFCKVTRFASLMGRGAWMARRFLGKPQPYPEFRTGNGEEGYWNCVSGSHRVSIPTLLIWMRHDPYFPLSIAGNVQKFFGDSRLVVLPGFGHAPHIKNPAGFVKSLGGFLETP